jgi:hypothetical protein
MDAGEENPKVWECYEYPLLPGGAVTFQAGPDAPVTECVLNLDSINRGFNVMSTKYPHLLADILKDDDDATTADVFLQCCVFGELVYG